jgi:alkyl hydroperoxide reductase subunit F
MKTLLIAKDIGGQVVWTYDIDNYLGFSGVDTADLISKFHNHVEKYDVAKKEGSEVISVELTGRIKKVTTSDNSIHLAKTVIIATGKRPRPLGVPGEKEFTGRGVAYCSTCDAPLYVDLTAAVVGGGNSALEAVIDLEKVANKVHLVSLTPLTGDPILTEKVEGMEKVDIYTEYNTTRIIGEQSVTGIEIESLKNGEKKVLDTDGVFIEIGLLPNSDLVIDTLTTNRIGEITVDSECRTGMTGVFAAGDVTNVPFKQVIVAAGEGAKAALSAYNYLINQR